MQQQRAGRYFRDDALDGCAYGGAAAYAAIGFRAGTIVPDVLVSVVRVCAAARAGEGGCGGSDAGVFCTVAGEEFSRGTGGGTGEVPGVLAGGIETFPGE